MNTYYINTNGESSITISLNKTEKLEDVQLPNIEYWKFVECNILEYFLFRFLRINEKVEIKREFSWLYRGVITWLKS